MLDGRAPDSLSEILLSLKYHQSHDTRSRLPYRLHIPRTNSMKRMFLYKAVKQRNKVSDNNSLSIIHGAGVANTPNLAYFTPKLFR